MATIGESAGLAYQARRVYTEELVKGLPALVNAVAFWAVAPERATTPGADPELAAIEAGAQDFEAGDEAGTTTFWTDPTDLDLVSRALPAQGFTVLSAKLGYKPKNPIAPSSLSAEQLEEVLDIDRFHRHRMLTGCLCSSTATNVSSPLIAFSHSKSYMPSTRMSTRTFKLVLPT